ncbi:MAG: tRNA (N(6)-L-threonylcarbamoyladenosine(37)-C(2))-methylthiotransferase MtaB [Bacteroidota bacterium]
MKRIALHTLGCKLNFAETSSIARQFSASGYYPVGLDDPADVVLIHTCSVTERADRECRQLVRRALRKSPDAFVIVAGCYAQLRPLEISQIEGVDLVLGTSEKFNAFSHGGDFRKRAKPEILVSSLAGIHEAHSASSAGFGDRTRAFLKIQDGCDYNCSFCTIPIARGESRSIPVDNLVAQAIEAVNLGYKEIVLTGVNVGDYGKKISSSLIHLLRELVLIEELDRVRISSIEPNLLNDELLDFWISEPKICKHFHIPLQSGSDSVLKEMRRRYMRSLYAEKVSRIKDAIPQAGIGSDVIVGFPGETDELFQETHDFLLELPVSYLHVFSYSERPNTPAVDLSGRVDARIRGERSERLRSLSIRKRRMFYESFVGQTVDVLLEGRQGRIFQTGLTGEYVRVNVEHGSDLTNQFVTVLVTGVEVDSCRGEVVNIDSVLSIQSLREAAV